MRLRLFGCLALLFGCVPLLWAETGVGVYAYPAYRVTPTAPYGFSVMQHVGQRSWFGLALEPDPAETWALRISSRIELGSPYAPITAYPLLSLRFDPAANAALLRVGGGLQTRASSPWRAYSEWDWPITSGALHWRLGVRLTMRWDNSITARSRQTEPQGVRYRPVSPRQTEALHAAPAAVELVATPTGASPTEAISDNIMTTTPRDGRYLNLGVYQHAESAQALWTDTRLRPYRSRLQLWPDPVGARYRLLLGPLTAAELQTLDDQLLRQGLDSFVVHIDNGSLIP